MRKKTNRPKGAGPSGWNCIACGKDCSKNAVDYFMLKDEIWKQINPAIEGMLCMKCVETKLGRKLMKEDILECFLTREINPYTAAILKKR